MNKTVLLTIAVLAATAAQARPGDRGERMDRRWDWSRPDLRAPVVVGENSGPVNLQLGQLLQVRLPVQAGTGYSWSAAPDLSPNLEFVGQHTLHPFGQPGVMGGSQTQMFTYRAIRRGSADLRFAYSRPWEGGVPPARMVDQRVTIGPWLQ